MNIKSKSLPNGKSPDDNIEILGYQKEQTYAKEKAEGKRIDQNSKSLSDLGGASEKVRSS